MTVLVTGGLGFIGSELTDQLLNVGREVVIYDSAGDTTILERYGIKGDVTTLTGDITETADIIRTVREWEITHIAHLAALLPEGAVENPRTAANVNIKGTNNILEAARLFNDQIKRVVLASSETVYAPDAAYDGPANTSDLLQPDGVYSAAKLYNERQADIYADRYNVNVVSLRPTGVYGPYRDSDEGYPELMEAAALGGIVTVTDNGEPRSWLHVGDAARAFRMALLADDNTLSQRVYNVRGELATVSEIVDVVQNVVPGVDVTIDGTAPNLTSAKNLNISTTQADLGYEIEYDLESFVRDYVNTLRTGAGLDPL